MADCPIAWLPEAYRDRVAAMTHAPARARTTAGLWLLGQALAERNRPADLARVGRSATGRPEIAGGPYFSISHSGDLVACALDEHEPVGLDVERRRSGISPRLERTIAGGDEDFFNAWCAREATVKLTGRVGLARIREIRLDRGRAWLDGRAWRLRHLCLVPGYAACLAMPDDRNGARTVPTARDLGGRL